MSLEKVIALEENTELANIILAKAAKNFYARGEKERFDLFPFYAILVSTGTNKNFDHFASTQLYQARHSPTDKPVNVGHIQNKIVGHIIDCVVVGEDLQPISEDTQASELPANLHVVMAGVIYKVWEDPKVKAEVDQLIDKVSKGTIYVSMEALFRDFDYLLTNASTNEQTIVPRNKETASLTKYLRQYKGPGKIYNYSLARVLKDITFSAVGIVEKPANPNSIISSSLNLFSSNAEESVYINLESTIGENIMSKETDKVDDKDYKSEATSLKADNDELKKENANLQNVIANLAAKVEAIEKQIKADDETSEDTMDASAKEKYESTIASLNGQVTKLISEKESLVKANDAQDATIKEFKKASKHTQRAEALMTVDKALTREQALAKVGSMDELSDTGFASMVEMLGTYASRVPQEVTPAKILNEAKAEEVAPLGSVVENNIDKTAADIKNFLSKKVNTKE